MPIRILASPGTYSTTSPVGNTAFSSVVSPAVTLMEENIESGEDGLEKAILKEPSPRPNSMYRPWLSVVSVKVVPRALTRIPTSGFSDSSVTIPPIPPGLAGIILKTSPPERSQIYISP